MDTTTIDRVVEMHKKFCELYKNSWLISIHFDDVLVREGSMTEIAPLGQWSLNNSRGIEDLFPYEHHIEVQGVTFCAVTTDPILLPEPEAQK